MHYTYWGKSVQTGQWRHIAVELWTQDYVPRSAVEQSATFPTFFPSKTVIICRRLEARTTTTRHQAQARGQAAQRSLSRQLFPVRFTFARIAMNAVIEEVIIVEQYSPHRPTSDSVFLNNYFLCQFTFYLTWIEALFWFLDAISISTVGCVTHVTLHHGFWCRKGLKQEGLIQEGLKQIFQIKSVRMCQDVSG